MKNIQCTMPQGLGHQSQAGLLVETFEQSQHHHHRICKQKVALILRRGGCNIHQAIQCVQLPQILQLLLRDQALHGRVDVAHGQIVLEPNNEHRNRPGNGHPVHNIPHTKIPRKYSRYPVVPKRGVDLHHFLRRHLDQDSTPDDGSADQRSRPANVIDAVGSHLKILHHQHLPDVPRPGEKEYRRDTGKLAVGGVEDQKTSRHLLRLLIDPRSKRLPPLLAGLAEALPRRHPLAPGLHIHRLLDQHGVHRILE
mmetsp:Transcript_59309/g.158798  ORF Transcript_59309/g.158798 Transcript_59309/m.158798 type:complete len:253 (+) Transcript_59309:937-1695(+)